MRSKRWASPWGIYKTRMVLRNMRTMQAIHRKNVPHNRAFGRQLDRFFDNWGNPLGRK